MPSLKLTARRCTLPLLLAVLALSLLPAQSVGQYTFTHYPPTLNITSAAYPKQLRVAVCCFGLTKSLQYTIDNIRSHLLDPLTTAGIDFKIYLHTYRATVINNPRSQEHAVPVDPTRFKLLHPHHYTTEPMSVVEKLRSTLDQHLVHGDPWREDHHTSLTNFLAQLRSLQKVTGMWEDKADTFDAVIYSRTDLWFYNKINITELVLASRMAEPTAFTPGFQLWGGLNDRFAFGNPAGMAVYGNRAQHALKFSQQQPLHAEIFLQHVISSMNVANFHTNLYFGRVRSTGFIQDLPTFNEHGDVVDAVDEVNPWKKLVKKPDRTWEFEVVVTSPPSIK